MKTLVVSSSFDPMSRSEELARMCAAHLSQRADVRFVSMKDYPLRGEDLNEPLKSENYRQLHSFASEADGLVLASPVTTGAVAPN